MPVCLPGDLQWRFHKEARPRKRSKAASHNPAFSLAVSTRVVSFLFQFLIIIFPRPKSARFWRERKCRKKRDVLKFDRDASFSRISTKNSGSYMKILISEKFPQKEKHYVLCGDKPGWNLSLIDSRNGQRLNPLIGKRLMELDLAFTVFLRH